MRKPEKNYQVIQPVEDTELQNKHSHFIRTCRVINKDFKTLADNLHYLDARSLRSKLERNLLKENVLSDEQVVGYFKPELFDCGFASSEELKKALGI